MDDDQFLTTEEVLGYLHVNLRTVYRLIQAGKLPAVRVGRQWRVRKSDIQAWLERHGQPAGLDESHPAKVLIVDDDDAARTLLADAFGGDAYDVDTVPDGATALERLNAAQYDLMVTDLKMAGMDGLTVIRKARQRVSGMPIIIVTGFSTEASAIEAINLGVRGYITKPFRKPRVLAVAARALGRQAPSTEVQV
jgi:excisionase family DNA binding protein